MDDLKSRDRRIWGDCMGNEKKYDGIADEILLERFQKGEQDIMDYILDKYKNLVRKRAKDMYLIGGEGEDLIQEGMIGLFKAVRDYSPCKAATFFTFADLCISRQIYSAIKASNRIKHKPLNTYISLYSQITGEENENTDRLLIEQLQGMHTESPESLMIDQENVEDLQNLITKILSKFEQEVILLYLAGYDYIQIAQMAGREAKAVDNALQRAKGKLASATKMK